MAQVARLPQDLPIENNDRICSQNKVTLCVGGHGKRLQFGIGQDKIAGREPTR
jgi:hypothetical protein